MQQLRITQICYILVLPFRSLNLLTLLPILQSKNQGVTVTVFSFESLWGRVHTQTHSGCWQNLIPWFCRTRTLFPCLLSASGCSWHLEASHWSLRAGPYISGPIEVLFLEPCWKCLISPYTLACFCLQLEKVLHFLLAHMIKSAPPE